MHSPHEIFISICCHYPPELDLSKMKHLFSPQLFHLNFLGFLNSVALVIKRRMKVTVSVGFSFYLHLRSFIYHIGN